MLNKKMFFKALFLIIVCFNVPAFFAACSGGSNSPSYTGGTDDGNDTSEDSTDYTLDSDITYITLNNTSISVNGSGASLDSSATVVTITAAGTYDISGTLNNGQVIINTTDEDAVKLIFDGMDITCTTSAPIYVENAAKTVIDLADGTTNKVTDGTTRTNTDINAAIFSNDYLSIYSDGTGSLAVTGKYKDGIGSDDGLLIASGTITVTSADDGVRGKDYLVIKSGAITVNSTGDGLKSSNETDSTKGYIDINGGTITVTSTGGDAVTAVTDVDIAAGTFILTSGGGSSSTPSDSISTKGIKGISSVTIDGGTVTVDSSDDALHSNGSITINSGTMTLSSNNSSSGQDGIHADTSVTFNGGTVTVAKACEGIEGKTLTVNFGTVNVTAYDDGFNATAGTTSGGTESSDGSLLTVAGGNVYVSTSKGDGFDSNGSIVISGGTVVVQGPSSQPEVALDYNGAFTLTGGLLIASGPSSGNMIQPQSSISTVSDQYCVKITGSLTTKYIHIQDASGNEIVTYKPIQSAYYILVSSTDFVQGSTYYVYAGGSYSDGTSVDGLYTGGSYSSSGATSKSFTPSTSLLVTVTM